MIRITNIIVLSLTWLLGACSLNQIDRSGISPEKDIFYAESFARRSNRELREYARNSDNIFTQKVSKCYLGTVTNHDFLKIQKENQNNPSFWLSRAICAQAQDNHRLANYYYAYTLELSKTSSKVRSIAYNNMGVILLSNHHYPEALEKFYKSQNYHKSDSASFNIAVTYLQFGYYEKSKRILSHLKSKNPNDPEISFTLATAFLLSGEDQKARVHFETIDSSLLKRSDISNFLSLLLFIEKDYEEAFRTLVSADFTQIPAVRSMSEALREKIINKKTKELEN